MALAEIGWPARSTSQNAGIGIAVCFTYSIARDHFQYYLKVTQPGTTVLPSVKCRSRSLGIDLCGLWVKIRALATSNRKNNWICSRQWGSEVTTLLVCFDIQKDWGKGWDWNISSRDLIVLSIICRPKSLGSTQ